MRTNRERQRNGGRIGPALGDSINRSQKPEITQWVGMSCSQQVLDLQGRVWKKMGQNRARCHSTESAV